MGCRMNWPRIIRFVYQTIDLCPTGSLTCKFTYAHKCVFVSFTDCIDYVRTQIEKRMGTFWNAHKVEFYEDYCSAKELTHLTKNMILSEEKGSLDL